MTNKDKELYAEFTSAKDKFCLLTVYGNKVIKAPFMTIVEAEEWATQNGYTVNVYNEGKLIKQIVN